MKKFIIYSLAIIAAISFASCVADNDELTDGAKTGGLLQINNSLVGYVVGNGLTSPYSASFTIFQGNVKTTQVDIYKVFKSAVLGTSNEVFLKTVTVPASPQSQTVNFDVTYNELIAGLLVGGNPLPASDALLNIGDSWTLKYVSKTSNGDSNLNASTTKVSVGTRFAGKYRVIQGEYWRINVRRLDVMWTGQFRTIESVNATTYKFLEYAGPFVGATNSHYFTISPTDVVRTPVTYGGVAQLLNGLPVINCEDTPGNITNACGFAPIQNTIVRDNVNGKDRIYRTYGYLAATGSREFYEVLEKVVD